MKEGRKLLANLHCVLDSYCWWHHVERQERGFFECLSEQDHDRCSEEILLVDSRDENQSIATPHSQHRIILYPWMSVNYDVVEVALFTHFLQRILEE